MWGSFKHRTVYRDTDNTPMEPALCRNYIVVTQNELLNEWINERSHLIISISHKAVGGMKLRGLNDLPSFINSMAYLGQTQLEVRTKELVVGVHTGQPLRPQSRVGRSGVWVCGADRNSRTLLISPFSWLVSPPDCKCCRAVGLYDIPDPGSRTMERMG